MKSGSQEKSEMRSFMSTMVAIAWSFIGLRRKKDFDEDIGRLNPVYVIIGALIATGIFIAVLLTIVHSIVP